MNIKMNFNRIRIFGCFFVLLLVVFAVDQYNSLAGGDRTFLNTKIEFLGEYILPETNYQNTVFGGISGITYNGNKDEYYLISDDRSNLSPARFYTAKIDISQNKIRNVKLENVTFLKNAQGQNYPPNTVDTEGIALSPRNTLFISSEGITNRNIAPFINEYDLNGNLLNPVKIPDRYIPNKEQTKGVQNNLGFESLAIKANGFVAQDPFRLFTLTESALIQDVDLDNPATLNRSRLLHYVINPFGDPVIIGEHLYIVDNPPSFDTVSNGVCELLALPQEGYLLSLERTFGLRNRYGAKLFQVVMANASDISSQKSISKNISNINPIGKKLLLDLKTLGIKLENLEGMTFGAKFPDGSQSLIIVSDNNFAKGDKERNQFLLFKLT